MTVFNAFIVAIMTVGVISLIAVTVSFFYIFAIEVHRKFFSK